MSSVTLKMSNSLIAFIAHVADDILNNLGDINFLFYRINQEMSLLEHNNMINPSKIISHSRNNKINKYQSIIDLGKNINSY